MTTDGRRAKPLGLTKETGGEVAGLRWRRKVGGIPQMRGARLASVMIG